MKVKTRKTLAKRGRKKRGGGGGGREAIKRNPRLGELVGWPYIHPLTFKKQTENCNKGLFGWLVSLRRTSEIFT